MLVNMASVVNTNIKGAFFFLIKPTDALISQIYFCQETLNVSDSSSAHHQEFSNVHSALVYVMQVYDRFQARPGRA